MRFRNLLLQRTDGYRFRTIEMRIQFAELCLSQPVKLTSEHVYMALTHLACIPELGIDVGYYDRLQDAEGRLNTDAYVFARNKIVEAKELLSHEVEEKYAVS